MGGMAITRRTPGTIGIGRRGILAERRGVAAVELAIIWPILTLVLIGGCDVGFMFYRQMQVDMAAYAGATYAAQNAWNQTSVQNAAQVATALGTGVSATATQNVGCLNTTTGAFMASGCSGNVTSGTYVTVATSYTFTPLAPYTGVVLPSTLTGTATVRTQ